MKEERSMKDTFTLAEVTKIVRLAVTETAQAYAAAYAQAGYDQAAQAYAEAGVRAGMEWAAKSKSVQDVRVVEMPEQTRKLLRDKSGKILGSTDV